MESGRDPTETLVSATKRHKCAGCFKQYKKKEHLVEHMKTSYHSVHQPSCEVCQKHCKSFESLREHTTGPLAKGNCSKIFAERGCKHCMRIFDGPVVLHEHQQICCLPASASPMPCTESQKYDPPVNSGNGDMSRLEAVAIDCEMVGGGSDGSLDLCVRVYEVTGITEDHLSDAMPLKEVQEKIMHILYNGESIGILRLNGGKARVLVGHGLKHDLDCLKMNYPDHLLRDTAEYPPLMKTNLVSHSLKYLVKTYLGYDIQSGIHDPYEDCVSVMRLYQRLRSKKHESKGRNSSLAARGTPGLMNAYNSLNYREIENMTPDELFDVSESNYRCWCLD
ncbi:hypothetical protein OROMI_015752 [Orobanche minor]